MSLVNEKTIAEFKKSKFCVYLIVAAKISVYILLMFGLTVMFVLFASIFQYIFPASKEEGVLLNILQQTCFLAGAFLAAYILLRNWDHLPMADLGLSLKGRGKDIFGGTLVALLIYAIGFGVLCGLGEIEIASVHYSAYSLLTSWMLMLLIALTEEIAFRGYVLGRMLHAGVNRYAALLLSSILFSLMHIFNPNFSCMSFLNLTLAGVLLGSTYIYTRNLWFPIALHLFWNWFQGPVLGFEVSGQQLGDTLLTLSYREENIINGGTFGFEGSILCSALMIIFILVILKSASKQSACGPCPHSAPAPGRADE